MNTFKKEICGEATFVIQISMRVGGHGVCMVDTTHESPSRQKSTIICVVSENALLHLYSVPTKCNEDKALQVGDLAAPFETHMYGPHHPHVRAWCWVPPNLLLQPGPTSQLL